MGIKDKINHQISEYEYAKGKYVPRFPFYRQARNAFVLWLSVMVSLFSVSIDMEVAVNGEAYGQAKLIGSIIVGLLLLCGSVIYAMNFDCLNSLLYALEGLVSWLGFQLATLIPFGKGTLILTTLVGLLMALAFSYIADKSIKELYSHDRIKRQDDRYQ